MRHAAAKAADAAFFEGWSAWASLDGLPPAPTTEAGALILRGARMRGIWLVPAHNWQSLRAALPAIKAAVAGSRR